MTQHLLDAETASRRDVTINIHARQRQRDLIDEAAAVLGKDRSDFMLETACREAESVLLDRRTFALMKPLGNDSRYSLMPHRAIFHNYANCSPRRRRGNDEPARRAKSRFESTREAGRHA